VTLKDIFASWHWGGCRAETKYLSQVPGKRRRCTREKSWGDAKFLRCLCYLKYESWAGRKVDRFERSVSIIVQVSRVILASG